MTDLLLTEGGDLALVAGDLALDPGLASLVVRSLLTDARATPDALAAHGTADPRGWWGETPGDPFGSTLWLLSREKRTPETIERAHEAAVAALRWLVDDGVAEAVEIGVAIGAGDRLHLDVRVRRGSAKRWSSLWTQVHGSGLSGERLSLAVVLDGSAG